MGHVRDRWMTRDPETGRRVRTERWGKGLRWQARAVRADGREASQSFATRDQADLWVATVAVEPHTIAPTVTFGAVASSWIAHHHGLRESSQASARSKVDKMVRPELEAVLLRDVTRARLQEVVTGWHEAGYAPSTIRTAWSYVVSVLREARLDGLLVGDPAEGVRLPAKSTERVVPLTDGQVRTLLAVMPGCLRPMVLLGAVSGLRPAELAGLTWDRVTATAVRVDRQLVTEDAGEPLRFGPPKSSAGMRLVGVGAGVVGVLEEHRRVHGEGPEGLVFSAPRGGLMTRRRRGETWRRYRGEIGGATGEGWHQLRHYHASKLIADGVSVVAVAARLGHKDVAETLATYAHLWPGDEAAMESVAVRVADALAVLDGPGDRGE